MAWSARTRFVAVTLAALAGVALTARLGWWQLDRAAQKTALQQAGEARRALPPVPAAATARTASEAAEQHGRATRLEGRWLAERTVYLDNRQMEARPGFFVVTPLLLADGSAVAVQRGWLPRDFQDRTRINPPVTPDGPVTVAGRIAPPPARLYELGDPSTGPIRQNLDLTAWATEIGVPLRPWSLVQEDAQPSSGPGPDGLWRRWPKPAADVSKHHGYAFQWFALATLIFGLYVWFQLIRPRRRGSR